MDFEGTPKYVNTKKGWTKRMYWIYNSKFSMVLFLKTSLYNLKKYLYLRIESCKTAQIYLYYLPYLESKYTIVRIIVL